MNVRQLKALLENVDEDLEVVVSGGDRSFTKMSGAVVQLAERNGRSYYQYYGDEHMSDGGVKSSVLFINDGRY